MKKLLLLFAVIAAPAVGNSKCTCDVFSWFGYILPDSCTFDPLTKTLYIDPGDTVQMRFKYPCAGYLLDVDNEYFINDIPVSVQSYGSYLLYEPAVHTMKSSCMPSFFTWRDTLRVAYNTTAVFPAPKPPDPLRLSYLPAENKLLMQAQQLAGSSAILRIFDPAGRIVYHSTLAFSFNTDKVVVDLAFATPRFAAGLYIATVEYKGRLAIAKILVTN